MRDEAASRAIERIAASGHCLGHIDIPSLATTQFDTQSCGGEAERASARASFAEVGGLSRLQVDAIHLDVEAV